jgi:hypothetical protein
MGEVKLENGMPSRHCGLLDGHPRHPNLMPVDGTYCNGVTPLQPFVELTVRVPTRSLLGAEDNDHQKVLALLHDEGLGILLDMLDREETRCALRVRAGAEDRVYPLLHRKGFPGFKAVVDAPQ